VSGEPVPADDLPDVVPASDLPDGGRYVVDPNALQRRAGIRRARFKDENLAGNIGSGFLTLGEDVGRETIGALHAGGLSPAAANVGGAIADAGTSLIPMGAGGAAGAQVGAPIMEAGAKRVMQSALKPTSKSLANGQAAKAIDTMLQEGVNATAGGAMKLRQSITKLKGEVADLIMKSPATVDKNVAYRELAKTLDDVSKKGSGYTVDRAAVLKAWDEFKAHPLLQGVGDQVPIQAADTVKRASQKAADSAYSSITPPGAADEAQKAIARGLRVGMEAAEPAVAPINAKLSEYINALRQIEPRAAMQANSELLGLAPIAGSAEGAMIMMAQRNPWMKSAVARVLYQSRRAAPGAAGAAIAMPEEQ
jgi:hypothetical protein